jgi:hypothetical protein
MPTLLPPRFRYVLGLGVLSLLIVGSVLALALARTQGQFTYAIDDTYIHLAFAGFLPAHLGTTPGIPAAASSSILYPWLLIPFSGYELSPFIFNLLALTLNLLLIGLILQRMFPVLQQKPVLGSLAVVLAALAFNLYTLPFLGLEHGFHVATTLAIFYGAMDMAEGKKPTVWLWLALLLNPLFRFEGLALSGLVLLWAMSGPQRKLAITVALAEMALQLAHAFWLHSHGLNWLPGSLFVKAEASLSSPLVWAGKSVMDSLTTPTSWSVIVIPVFLLFLLPRNRFKSIIIVALLAHLVFGRLRWLDRYHAYLLALSCLMVLYMLRETLTNTAQRRQAFMLAALILVIPGWHSFITLSKLPQASQEIFLQQRQLASFVQNFWQHPVAMNDIGLVSWRNPQQVHDLLGLGSEEIRRIRQPDNFWSTEEFRTYFKKNNLALAISYPSWTTNHPAEWLEIASYGLTTPPPDNMVVIAFDKVSFYLTDPAYKQELLDKLHQWQKTLPQGTYLKINEP